MNKLNQNLIYLLKQNIISTFSTNNFITLEVQPNLVDSFTNILNYIIKKHNYKITDIYYLSPDYENRTVAIETNIPFEKIGL